VAFAFLLGLSLAIINALFPPERQAAAIALYLGAGFALTTPMPALGSLLAEHIGWRSGFLVAPAAALITRSPRGASSRARHLGRIHRRRECH
jgi:predicted MFS family arabinose efflux permease